MRLKLISLAFAGALAVSSVGAAFAFAPGGNAKHGHDAGVVRCKEVLADYKNLGECVSSTVNEE